jgi:hypothetical protein
LLEQSLAIKEEHYGPKHISLAFTLLILGATYGILGNYQKLIELPEQCLAIQEIYCGPNHFRLAVKLLGLWRFYAIVGNPQKQMG